MRRVEGVDDRAQDVEVDAVFEIEGALRHRAAPADVRGRGGRCVLGRSAKAIEVRRGSAVKRRARVNGGLLLCEDGRSGRGELAERSDDVRVRVRRLDS